MLSRIRKALVAGLTAGLATLGVDLSDVATVEWWTPIALAAITGFVTYWTPSNEPGTLLHDAQAVE